jgi:hypothetical protein
MREILSACFGGIVVATARLCFAQQPLPATTVQLPTFSVFTVQTTVSVPDGGTAYLGGINRGAEGSATRGFGPLKSRSFGSSRTASGVSVSATIIDHAEIDRALLAEAGAKRGSVDSSVAKAAAISKGVAAEPWFAARPTATRTPAALPGSVAAMRKQNVEAADLVATELAGYLAKGKQAEAENKPGVARVFYQMVARRDQGEMKRVAVERLAVLGNHLTK